MAMNYYCRIFLVQMHDIIIDNVERKIERQDMIEAIRTLDDRERYIMASVLDLTGKD